MAQNGNFWQVFMANDGLTPSQSRLIAALLTERNLTQAAKIAKISERTARRWQALPAFREALRQAEGELLALTNRRLLAGNEAALETLESTLNAPRDADRIRAAAIWLSMSARYHNETEITKIIAEIETRLLRGGK